ncbi:MAG TPA: zinc ABC transporter substrate-binding protein [Candidatus Macondimonas sp.]|nr:zinc ABC transporter substrate-binding protein [Candidatus Macondimonas sp.]
MSRLTLLTLWLCWSGLIAAAPAPVKVAVGVPVLKTFVERIGGTRVEVLVLQGGGDPHAFEPSARQIAGLTDARLYVLAGLPFEAAWLPRLQAINPDLRVLDLREVVTPRALDDPWANAASPARFPDPHVWTDPQGALPLVAAIASQLTLLDPVGEAVYREGGRRLSEDLRALEAEIAPLLAPLRGRILLVFHPGWGYLADHHGLRQIPIEVAGREPSASQLNRLLALSRQEHIGILFLQPGHGDRLARQLARELDIAVVVADPLAADYFGNVRALVRALAQPAVRP